MAVALVVLERQGRGFGRAVRKQQHVRNVFTAFARQIDLRQGAITPSQRGQYLVYDFGFGLRFVQGGRRAESTKYRAQSAGEVGKLVFRQVLPWRRFRDTARQKVLGEELALHL